jgi:hypothetical protein
MRSQKYRINFSEALAAQVQALAEDWHLPFAAVVRLAVRDLLVHQERMAELAVVHTPFSIEDMRTEQQVSNWERDKQRFEDIDLEVIAAQICSPGAGA